MRRFLSAVVLSLAAWPVLAAGEPPHDMKKDPVVGRWICRERLGDGTSYGFCLKEGGVAKAVHTATMRVEHWRRVDATHIELTEVSEGNHTKLTDKVRYEVVFHKDGSMTLKSVGKASGMYAGTYTAKAEARK